VNHIARREPVALGDARLAGRAATQGASFGQQFRAGRAMNRAIHAAARQG
jgi:hypothetical protein